MNSGFTDESLVELGRQALTIEIDGLRAQLPRLGVDFARACRICLNCRGRVVVTGMGKSGHIGGKIAATLASTGTPSFFMHPAEASHGDVGMITRDDVLLALSNSGETEEILTILPAIKRLGVPLIAFTGNADSALARIATVHLNIGLAMHSPWRFSRRAASPKRISRARTRPETWAGGCCSCAT
jgi:arabinose-5-phosphate isomerase